MSLLPSGTRFNKSLKGDARCVAMRLKKLWSYDLDLFSAAATSHVVLFGKYITLIEIKSLWKPTCKPKRFWEMAATYEKLLEVLINPPQEQKVQLEEFSVPLQQYAKQDSCVVNEELDSLFQR
jgi:hypothetical protein